MFEKLKNEEESIESGYGLIMISIVAGMQVFKFIGVCCCNSCISFGANVIWMGIELILVIILGLTKWTFETAIAAPLISISLSFVLIAWSLLRLHLDLMARHLTEKEWDARLKTCYRLEVDDELIRTVTCR